MEEIKRIKAVVFDLYGTLISLKKKSDPYKKIIKKLGLKSEENRYIIDMILTQNHKNLKDLINKIKQESYIDIKISESESDLSYEINSAEVYSDTLDTIYFYQF